MHLFALVSITLAVSPPVLPHLVSTGPQADFQLINFCLTVPDQPITNDPQITCSPVLRHKVLSRPREICLRQSLSIPQTLTQSRQTRRPRSVWQSDIFRLGFSSTQTRTTTRHHWHSSF
ncbi:hypothetical protein BGW80DRAFT_3412 [Lactifluus volemus]|nr:hypothetical protein BGW80DRAFT_3412 [Lactifluus volemus]